MAIQFLEDFTLTTTLNDIFGGSNGSVNSNNGRFGSPALRSAQSMSRTSTFSGNLATVIVNMGINLSTGIGSTGGQQLGFALFDGGTSQVGFVINSSHQIVFGRGPTESTGGTVLGTVPTSLIVGAQYHLEIKFTISDASGVVEVWLNGVQVLNLTSVDTKASANAYATGFKFFHGNFTTGNGQMDFSQIVMMDTTGSYMNDLIGDIRLLTDAPTGDSATEQMSRSAGSDSFALVDETPGNDDTDYIFDSVSGNKTRLTYPSLSPTPSAVHCVALRVKAKKTDAGAITFNHNIDSNGTEDNGPNQSPGTSYLYFNNYWYRDPDTGTPAWISTTVNAAEIGVKIT